MLVSLEATRQFSRLSLDKWRDFLRSKGFEILVDEITLKEYIDSKKWEEQGWKLLSSDELKLLEFQHNSYLHIPRVSFE